MLRSEEIDLREGLVYDPYVKRYDSNFWQGDTANQLFDTVQNAIKIGDTALVGAMSSFSQYLYGDFEFIIQTDCLSPDSNDSERRWGLMNRGDPLLRGCAFFAAEYDTLTGADTATTTQLWCVIRDEQGARQRKRVTWDSNWGNHANTRYRIQWEDDGVIFSINDSVVATLGDKPDSSNATFQINSLIPQALRISNRSLDTTDTNPMRLMGVTVRHARKII